jgi:hypothetical protein
MLFSFGTASQGRADLDRQTVIVCEAAECMTLALKRISTSLCKSTCIFLISSVLLARLHVQHYACLHDDH